MSEARPAQRRPVGPGLLVGLPLVALFVLLAASDGGYAPRLWLGASLAVAGVLMALAIALRAPSMPMALAVAVVTLGLYTAWSYASVAWAGNEADALEGAHRTALFFAAFLATAILPWPRRQAAAILFAFAGGAAILGLVTLVRLHSADAAELFVEARLSTPIRYTNANAALWTMAALPGIVLAEHRGLPALFRGAALATSTLAIGLAVLSQSRGWLFTVPLVLVLLLALHPARGRLLASMLLAGTPVAVASGTLLGVYADAGPQGGTPLPAGTIDELAASAAGALALATLLAFVVGVLVAGADRTGRLSRVASRRAAVLGAAGALTVLAALPYVAWSATSGEPVERLRSAWTEFSGNTTDPATTETRFAALGSQRYDGWRVAVDAWAERPLTGLGQDNFAELYLLEREVNVEPRWVHSLPLRLLAHTGLVGALLFLLFCGALAVAYVRAAREPATRRLQVALVAPALVWLISGSVDWFWEVPALTLAALVLLAVGARIAPVDEPAPDADAERAPRRVRTRVALAAVAAGIAAAALPAWAAAVEIERGIEATRSDPAGAVRHLERAADLNPLADRPLVLAGIAHLHRGHRVRADRAFVRALERNPHNWVAWLERGLLAAEAGRAAVAKRHVARAHRLTPVEPVLAKVAADLRANRRVSLDDVNAQLRARTDRRTGSAAASRPAVP